MFSYSLLTIALASFVIPCLCQLPESVYPCYDFADCKGDGPDKEALEECYSKLTEKDKGTLAKHLAPEIPELSSGDFEKNRELYCAIEDTEPIFKKIFNVYSDYYLVHCQLPGDTACDRMMDAMECFFDLSEEMDEDGRCKD